MAKGMKMEDVRFDACMKKMREGDKEGLKEIYDGYAAYIWSVVYGIVQNKENAEDITSDFFIKLWEKADSYRPGGGHRTYLTVMARNMAVDHIRKYHREEAMEIAYLEEETRESQPEQQVISRMTVEEALKMLNDKERQIINLKIMGDLTFQEISRVIKQPMGTATWRYRNALAKLRRCGYE